MQVSIQSLHFTASQRLLSFIEEKSAKLPRYFNNITDVVITLKLQKGANNDNKQVEVKLLVPQNVIIAKETGKSFESAFDVCLDKVSRQLTDHKERLRG
jgi:putative sigma-54 modulation protein